MRFPPSLLDEIRARLPVSQVVSRRVRLKRNGRESVGLSPFKDEKTPSFTVNDQKGFYHCFATGEHGDIFKFVMTTEGLTFPEAVERLAGEAGVVMPQSSPEAEQREEERDRLIGLLEASAAFFQTQLAAAGGREARAYLDKRQVARDSRRSFRLGFAPDSRHALKDYLAGKGYSGLEMARAGMTIAGDDIPVPYDRFRNRLMFPILDLSGKVVAFGGRALDANAPAKYLNSPETPLFHKGHMLFNAQRARKAAHDSQSVIVVEGYMDVIALADGGFENAVAPLGTALTPDQIKLLWRMAPEPTLCFDGDGAGVKAANRAAETVLPLLHPGHSLRFAFLPQGLDPDDLIRAQGRDAMQQVLDGARQLSLVLWDKEYLAGDWSTPERRAALEDQMMRLVGQIGHERVREHYRAAMRERFSATWAPARSQGHGNGHGNGQNNAANTGFAGKSWVSKGSWRPAAGGGRSGGAAGGAAGGFDRAKGRHGQSARFDRVQPALPSASLRASALVRGDAGQMLPREVQLIRMMLHHPWLLDDFAEEIAALSLNSVVLGRLRDAMLDVHATATALDSDALKGHLARLGHEATLGLLSRATTHRSDRFSEPGASAADVLVGWRHVLALHRHQHELRLQLVRAEREYQDLLSEDALAQLTDIKAQLEQTEGREATLEGYEAAIRK